ncbi:hypothetical protein R4Z09_19110 [Niallia oryzisoli]|uniref:Uncharacterized protein n=1 Tax=Niallia oryzisoli TaxID=1737571 RepID=A0ABZ2C783_9BACI
MGKKDMFVIAGLFLALLLLCLLTFTLEGKAATSSSIRYDAGYETVKEESGMKIPDVKKLPFDVQKKSYDLHTVNFEEEKTHKIVIRHLNEQEKQELNIIQSKTEYHFQNEEKYKTMFIENEVKLSKNVVGYYGIKDVGEGLRFEVNGTS